MDPDETKECLQAYQREIYSLAAVVLSGMLSKECDTNKAMQMDLVNLALHYAEQLIYQSRLFHPSED